MKKIICAISLGCCLLFTASITHAADTKIQVDGVTIQTDASPEVKNSRVMVPLRVVSENLGATVQWATYGVTLTKGNTQIVLKAGSSTAKKNGKTIKLDSKPYIKNNHTYVPLRLMAENFGGDVEYRHSIVSIHTPPFLIGGTKIKAVQQEFHMTMGGIVQQIRGNVYNQKIYDTILKYKGKPTKEPKDYSWANTIDTLGSYYKNSEYNFLDSQGKSIKRYDTYSLIQSFPDELLTGYPLYLLHDVTVDKWYLFDSKGLDVIGDYIDQAEQNGFKVIISNTVV